MRTYLYLPVNCPNCGRMSVASVSTAVAQCALNKEKAISLTCAFDRTIWNADTRDREYLLKLLEENERLGDMTWLRLRDESRGVAAI